METPNCSICYKPKAPYKCGICSCVVCKSCAEFGDEAHFSFLTQIPEELKHDVYCGPCHDKNVEPQYESYNDMMERAKTVDVYFKDQGKETRLIKRAETPLRVTECPDREETLLRLAFLAAQSGFNTLIDVVVTHKKIRNEGYQKMMWSGMAVPTNKVSHKSKT